MSKWVNVLALSTVLFAGFARAAENEATKQVFDGHAQSYVLCFWLGFACDRPKVDDGSISEGEGTGNGEAQRDARVTKPAESYNESNGLTSAQGTRTIDERGGMGAADS